MKKNFLFNLLFLLCVQASAQKFQESFRLALPDSITAVSAEWHDLDNDGLMEIVLCVKSAQHRSYLMLMKGDTMNLPKIDKVVPLYSHEAYSVVDFNNDNQLDVLISGHHEGSPLVAVYLNRGDFIFTPKVLTLPEFSVCRFGDVDNNGYQDCILAGVAGVFIAPGTMAGIGAVSDTLNLVATDLEILDADGDGMTDLFVSGVVNADSSFTGVLFNQGTGAFTKSLYTSCSGNGTVAYVDEDAFPDIIFSADSAGTIINRIFKGGGGIASLNEFPIVVKESFGADFNADGITDIAIRGQHLSDIINLIRYADNHYDTLPSQNLIEQFFSDPEHDGALDVLQIIRQDSFHVVVLKNSNSTENKGPSAPARTIALDVFGNLLLYWDEASDDHTPAELITYDLWMENSDGVSQSSRFDLKNKRRLTAEHGNAESQNFRFIQNFSTAGLGYQVQSIDNALHAAADGGVCTGGPAEVCLSIAESVHTVNACRRKDITLTGPEGVLWFSFREGYRGTGNNLTVDPQRSDTIFYFNPSEGNCFGLKLFNIIIEEDTISTLHPARYACEGAEIDFDLSPTLQPASWSSTMLGFLGVHTPLHFSVIGNDTVMATIYRDQCSLVFMTPIRISKPDVRTEPDRYKILRGAGVQLNVDGAQLYAWDPPTGLSDVNASNPIASPIETIQYTVTGYDSLNCEGAAEVTVIVEETGFVPSLFTPNDDGQNDVLKVYSLSDINDLSFSIYDREGTLVFHTRNLSLALEGWDGTHHGLKQPAGVYFWKVSGSFVTGRKLTLNGKDSGSVVLIR
jgi:gliding motility-associated-like protein